MITLFGAEACFILVFSALPDIVRGTYLVLGKIVIKLKFQDDTDEVIK